MSNARLSVSILCTLLVAGCGGGGGGSGGSFAGSTSPTGGDNTPATPTAPSTPQSQPSSGSSSSTDTSTGGGTTVAAILTVTHITGPQAFQPGERNNLSWQTNSPSEVTATWLEWGTAPGSHPNTVSAQSTVSNVTSGSQAWAASLTAPQAEGTVYYDIAATNADGTTVRTAERSFPIEWVTPTGAVAFTTRPGLAIPDNDPTGVVVDLQASGPSTVASVFVRVDIDHPRRGDLAITLTDPKGKAVRLLDSSTDPNADVFGTFGDTLPTVDSLKVFKGLPMAGTWKLTVVDKVSGAVGTINSVTLFIQSNAAAGAPESLPDLVVVPPYAITIANLSDGGRALVFNNTVRNLGDGPLEFSAVENSATGQLDCVQRIYSASRDSSGNLQWSVSRDVVVGKMFFTDYGGVPRYNLQGFATYRLYDVNLKVLESVEKISYCVDDGGFQYLEPSLPNYQPARVYWCGMGMQGISVGHADTYAGGCAQQFLITNQPDGDYYLESQFSSIFVEKDSANRTNDSAATKVRIKGNSYQVIEELDGAAWAARKAAAH